MSHFHAFIIYFVYNLFSVYNLFFLGKRCSFRKISKFLTCRIILCPNPICPLILRLISPTPKAKTNLFCLCSLSHFICTSLMILATVCLVLDIYAQCCKLLHAGDLYPSSCWHTGAKKFMLNNY